MVFKKWDFPLIGTFLNPPIVSTLPRLHGLKKTSSPAFPVLVDRFVLLLDVFWPLLVVHPFSSGERRQLGLAMVSLPDELLNDVAEFFHFDQVPMVH